MEDMPIISSYSLEQAVTDGALVEILKHRWSELTGGKPLVATIGVSTEISLAGIMEIWNEYVGWVTNVMPTLPEEERMFATKMNEQKVWVIDDGTAFTVLFPSEY